MTKRSYTVVLAATVEAMAASGRTSATWEDIIEELRAPHPYAEEEVDALLDNSDRRRLVCDLLFDASGLLAVQTNDRYTTVYLPAPDPLTVDEATKFIAKVGTGGTGIRICPDDNDPFWVAKEKWEEIKFGRGIRSRNDRALEQAARSGNKDRAKALITEGFGAAVDKDADARMVTELASHAPPLLKEAIK